MAPDISGWFLQRTVRRDESRARKDVEWAMELVQQALATRSQPSVHAALAAVSKAINDAVTATSSAQRLIVHQQRVQVDLTPAPDSSASLAHQAMDELATHMARDSQAVAADQSGREALKQLEQAGAVMTGVESAITQAGTAVHDVLASKTRYEQERQGNLAVARARGKYLAQFGGVDPTEMATIVLTHP